MRVRPSKGRGTVTRQNPSQGSSVYRGAKGSNVLGGTPLQQKCQTLLRQTGKSAAGAWLGPRTARLGWKRRACAKVRQRPNKGRSGTGRDGVGGWGGGVKKDAAGSDSETREGLD